MTPSHEQITPVSQHRSFVSVWTDIFKNVREYSSLLRQLVRVNLFVEYKKSVIGVLWLAITPLAAAGVWFLMKLGGVISPGDLPIAYPVYVMLGASLWQLFTGFYKKIGDSLVSYGKVLIMTKFPHELLVLEKALVLSINFSILLAINLVILLSFGATFSVWTLLVPIALIPIFLLGAALGMIFAVLKVVAVDISKAFDRMIPILFFATPIIYSPKVEGTFLEVVVQYNPLTYILGFSRELLVTGQVVQLEQFLICSGASLLFFVFAFYFYLRTESVVMEKLVR